MTTHDHSGNWTLLFCIMFFIVLAFFAGIVGPYLLHLELQHNLRSIETLSPLLVQDTGLTIMYSAPLGGVAFFIMALIGSHRLITGNSSLNNIRDKFVKIVAFLIMLGLVGIWLGRHVANNYWGNVFQKAEYTRCTNSLFITSRWFSVVWVQDPVLCRDKDVHRMMMSSQFRVEDINNYLRESE